MDTSAWLPKPRNYELERSRVHAPAHAALDHPLLEGRSTNGGPSAASARAWSTGFVCVRLYP